MEQKIQPWRPSPTCLYMLGFIGAVIHYISHAVSFGMGVLGVLKALVWPVFLVYEALEHLNR